MTNNVIIVIISFRIKVIIAIIKYFMMDTTIDILLKLLLLMPI